MAYKDGVLISKGKIQYLKKGTYYYCDRSSGKIVLKCDSIIHQARCMGMGTFFVTLLCNKRKEIFVSCKNQIKYKERDNGFDNFCIKLVEPLYPGERKWSDEKMEYRDIEQEGSVPDIIGIREEDQETLFG